MGYDPNVAGTWIERRRARSTAPGLLSRRPLRPVVFWLIVFDALLLAVFAWGAYSLTLPMVIFDLTQVELVSLDLEECESRICVESVKNLRIAQDGTITTEGHEVLGEDDLLEFLFRVAEMNRVLDDPDRRSPRWVRVRVDRRAPFAAFRRLVEACGDRAILLEGLEVPYLTAGSPAWGDSLYLSFRPTYDEECPAVVSAHPDVPMQQVLEALVASRPEEPHLMHLVLGAKAPEQGEKTVTVK